MSFETPKSPQAWQNHYTEKQAHHESMRRSQGIQSLQVLFFVIAYGYALLHIWAYFDWAKEPVEGNPIVLNEQIIIMLLGLLLMALHIVPSNVVIRSAALSFLENFYSMDKGQETKSMLALRLNGVPALPPPLSQLVKFPEVKVNEGKLEPPDHWSTIVGGPVKIKLEKGQAAYLEHEGRFSRVVGQGDAFLHWEERIAATADLGTKAFDLETKAWTRDGLPVTVRAKGEFSVGSATRTEANENVLIPFDAESAKKAVEHCLKNGKDANAWLESATGAAKGAINNFIINRYLDQIFVQEEGDSALLTRDNTNEIAAKINETTQKYGVYLSYFQIMEIKPPQQVIQLRKQTLKTEQENTALVTQSAVLAHQIRTREKLRAQMQRDLIMTIASGLNRTDGVNFPEQLMLSISGFLDQNIADPTVRANLHKETLETLEKLQEAIKFPSRLSEDENEA